MTTNERRDLRLQIEKHFSLDDLKELAFDLDVDWDELAGERKSGKVLALISHVEKQGRLQELVQLLRADRPLVAWINVASTEAVSVEEDIHPGFSVKLFLLDREARYSDKIVFTRHSNEAYLKRRFGVALTNVDEYPLKHIRVSLELGWGGGDTLSVAPAFDPPMETAWKAVVRELVSEHAAVLDFYDPDFVCFPHQPNEWRGFTLFHNEPNWKGWFRVYCKVWGAEPYRETQSDLVIEVN